MNKETRNQAFLFMLVRFVEVRISKSASKANLREWTEAVLIGHSVAENATSYRLRLPLIIFTDESIAKRLMRLLKNGTKCARNLTGGEVEMSATEKVVNDLNVSKLMLCNPKMLTSEMCIKIGQAINGAIDLLKEQKAIPVDTKVIGTFNGDMEVYCCRDCRTILDPAFHYCPNCGQEVKWE